MRIVDSTGKVLMQHEVEKGDIWRACQTKDEPVRDWVKLPVSHVRVCPTPAVFWLDAERAHDMELAKKVKEYLKTHDTEGLDIHIIRLRHSLFNGAFDPWQEHHFRYW